MNKKALLILPHYGFRDKEYQWTKEKLEEKEIKVEVASSHQSVAVGRFGLEVIPDVLIEYVESGDYDIFIFIGEEASKEYFNDTHVKRIIENAFTTKKLIGAIGEAVNILTYTNHIVRKKVTGAELDRYKIEQSGAYYTGRLVEHDENVITAIGPYATLEFVEKIIKVIERSCNTFSSRSYLQ
jgi:putative intracellular protease/amidase